MTAITEDYSDSTIKRMSILEHVRKKPGVHFGDDDLSLKSNCHMFKELVDNSFDESLDSDRKYQIKVLLFRSRDYQKYQVAIIDHGRGVPINMMADIYTQAYVSGKYEGKYGGATSGTNGVGAKVSVAVSTEFVSLSKRSDGFGAIRISTCKITSQVKLPPLDQDASTNGTTVFYEPDASILVESNRYLTDPEGLPQTFELLDFLTSFKTNTQVTVYEVPHLLTKKWLDETPFPDQWRYFQETKGKVLWQSAKDANPDDYVRRKLNITQPDKWDWSATYIGTGNDRLNYRISLHLVKDCRKQKGIIATINSVPISDYGSSHVSGVMDTLKSFVLPELTDVSDELKLFFRQQYRLPVYGYINAEWLMADFANQAKTAFHDRIFLEQYSKSLEKYCKTLPPAVWIECAALIMEDLQEQFVQLTNREQKITKNLRNVAYKLNLRDTFVPCDNKTPAIMRELFITEGTSAGGSVNIVRDPAYQAVLNLRGKPLNVLTANAAKIKADKALQDLIQILQVSDTANNLDTCEYGKIILLADADPDGYHIVSLLIGIMMKINPLLITEGRVAIANPPLYLMALRKQNVLIRDAKARLRVRLEIYRKVMVLSVLQRGTQQIHQLTPDEFDGCLQWVTKFGAIVTEVAGLLSIDPDVLEALTYCLPYLHDRPDCDKIRQTLQLERCTYNAETNSLVLVYNQRDINVPLMKLKAEMCRYLLPELVKMQWHRWQLLVTSCYTERHYQDPISIMHLYQLLQGIDAGFQIRRFKGLGECSKDQLRDTCVNPSTRVLSTVYSLGDVDRIYALLGTDTTERKKLIVDDLNGIMAD